jgi:hypothetical protein
MISVALLDCQAKLHHSASPFIILSINAPTTVFVIPDPRIVIDDSNRAKRLPFETRGRVDCHHDTKLAPAIPVEQNPAADRMAIDVKTPAGRAQAASCCLRFVFEEQLECRQRLS